MRKISLYLTICLMAVCVTFPMTLNAQGQETPKLDAPAPLAPQEKRQILDQLRELETCRPMVQAYEEFISREKELDAKEKENWQKALDLEKERTALEKKRADMEADKAIFYEDLYKAAIKKKGGIKCFLKRFFSAGLARC